MKIKLITQKALLVLFILTIAGCNSSVDFNKAGDSLKGSLEGLDIFKNAVNKQPAFFHFRHPERFITDYDTWFKIFGSADGILVNYDPLVNNYEARLAAYNRYKKENPEKMLVAHFNAVEIDPRVLEEGRYFPGHWLYHQGCKAVKDIPADTGVSEISVEDTSLYKMNYGRNQDRNEDILLVAIGDDGKPNWYYSEEVTLVSVNQSAKTITVKRGQYNTAPKSFKAGEVYILSHATGGPWKKDGNLLWRYNFSVDCPRDKNGKRALDILAEDIINAFKKGGIYENFDGIEFDIPWIEFWNYNDYNRGIDTNGDLIPDNGIIKGENKFGIGFLEFLVKLRKGLGDSKLIMADGDVYYEQRGFGVLNGIESEGFIDALFRDFEWSWGINRHNFWYENSYNKGPEFSYINHKYSAENKDNKNIDRMSFAAALFTNSFLGAINLPFERPYAQWPALGMPVWDEMVAGEENMAGWLGSPLGPTVDLAEKEGNLVEGITFTNEIDYIFPIADSYTGGAYPDMNYGSTQYLSLNRGNAIYLKFDIPPGIEADTQAVLQLQVTSIMGEQLDPSAKNTIHLYKSDNTIWKEDSLTRNNSIEIKLIDTGRGADVSIDLWKKSLNIDITGLLPEEGGAVTFCLKADTGSRYTLSSREGVAMPKIILNKKLSKEKTIVELSVDEEKSSITAKGLSKDQCNRNRIIFSTDWFKAESRDLTIFTNLISKGGDSPLEERARLVQVRVIDRNGHIYGDGFNMSWANNNEFKAGFYFDNLAEGSEVRIEFEAEGAKEMEFKNISVYAFPDVKYREYEGGIVIANPSQKSGFTFNIAEYLPGGSYIRLTATEQQDKVTNNGQPVENGKVTLGQYDAVFLRKS